MSGFVGIVNTDGASMDRKLIRSMVDYLSFRGPDETSIWVQGHIGFGHTMLRTTFEAAHEKQPSTLNNLFWMTGDVRLDGRGDLVRRLQEKKCAVAATAPDSSLVLHAYRVWGHRCTDHLLGDFSFAIWDCASQTLFCARDHFGVKPFYYACVKDRLIFSNTLNCVRLHPLVSRKLNPQAIANFLFFRYQPRLDVTVFEDIHALRPAHTLVYRGGLHELRRYWTLPIEEPLQYRAFDDYVDQFKELFDTAVDDRLRTDRAAVSMSGGLDSTSIAATAHRLLSRQGLDFDLRAYTLVHERFASDEEGLWSRMVGDHLGIPVDTVAVDDFKLFQGWNRPNFHLPEPANCPACAIDEELHRRMVASGSRVVFIGQGGDPVFLGSPALSWPIIKSQGVIGSLRTVSTGIRLLGRIPPLGIRSTLKRWRGNDPHEYLPDERFETLLNPAFLERIDPGLRWWQFEEPRPRHPYRPNPYNNLVDPSWPICFEGFDGTSTHLPLEFRFPYFDTRLVRFLLRVPAPYCNNKLLLRAAMRCRLPEAVRTRPKTPLRAPANDQCVPWIIQDAEPCEEFAQFVATEKLDHLVGQDGIIEADKIRLVALNYWLKHILHRKLD